MVRDRRPRRDAPVAFHRHDREVATESVLGIHEPRDLSGRHPMANGNRVETDEREKLFLGQVPLDDLPTERIRPIEDDDGDPAAVYPGGCLVEGTNLSEGRGTTRPFELLGAPWLDADEAADAGNSLDMPGVVFRPHVFRPTFHKHAGETCGGVQVHVTNAASFRPYEAYLRLVKALHDLDPGRFRWRTEKYEYRDDVPAIDLLTGTATYRRLVGTGEPLGEWISSLSLIHISEPTRPY